MRKQWRVDFTSITGVPVAIALILVGQMIEGGSVSFLLQKTAAMIVFGGTLGAVLLSFSFSEVIRSFGALRTVFLWEGESQSHTIHTLVEHAGRVRRDGVMSLERYLPNISDSFLRKAIQLLLDGTKAYDLREMLETENHSREEYDEIPAKVYEAA